MPDKSVTVPSKSGQQRFFFTMVNASRKSGVGRICCPNARAGMRETDATLHIPAGGARLFELATPQRPSDCTEAEMLDVSFQADAVVKFHLLCATPNLDRWSMDHL